MYKVAIEWPRVATEWPQGGIWLSKVAEGGPRWYREVHGGHREAQGGHRMAPGGHKVAQGVPRWSHCGSE